MKRGVAILLVAGLLMAALAGCAAGGTAGKAAGPELRLMSMYYSEIREFPDGGGTVIAHMPDRVMQPKEEYTVLRDSFLVHLRFDRPVTEEEFRARLTVEPARPVDVRAVAVENGNVVEFRLKEPLAVGEKVAFRLEGVWFGNGTKPETAEWTFTRVAEPKVAITCLTYPDRPARFDAGIEYSLPAGEVAFRTDFSRPMDRTSVEKVLGGIFSEVNFDWESDQSLCFAVEGEKDKLYRLAFDRCRDTTGREIVAQPVFGFRFAAPKSFYAYSLTTGKETRRQETHLIATEPSLAPDKATVFCREIVSAVDAFGYWDYVLDLATGKAKRVGEVGRMSFELAQHPAFWSPDGKYFAYGAAVYNRTGAVVCDFGVRLHGVAFAPDGKRLAAVVAEDDNAVAGGGQGHLVIYELPSGKLLRKFPGLTSLKVADGVFFLPVHLAWLDANRLLFERAPGVARLDLATGKSEVVLSDATDPSLSPQKDKVFVRRADGCAVYNLATRKLVRLDSAASPAGRPPVWTDDGRQFAFSDYTGKMYTAEAATGKVRSHGVTGEVAGWLDDTTLLLYR